MNIDVTIVSKAGREFRMRVAVSTSNPSGQWHAWPVTSQGTAP
jgi:hypothetical protein